MSQFKVIYIFHNIISSCCCSTKINDVFMLSVINLQISNRNRIISLRYGLLSQTKSLVMFQLYYFGLSLPSSHKGGLLSFNTFSIILRSNIVLLSKLVHWLFKHRSVRHVFRLKYYNEYSIHDVKSRRIKFDELNKSNLYSINYA